MGKFIIASLSFACSTLSAAHAQTLREFSSQGLQGSRGIVVRVSHPADWKRVDIDDPLALAEIRGPQGNLTGILQIARGRQRPDAESCRPERASSMLRNVTTEFPDARVLDVVARKHGDRPAYDIRYERKDGGEFMLVRSVIVCLQDSRVLVSCGGAGRTRAALAAIEPVCGRVLESLAITEE